MFARSRVAEVRSITVTVRASCAGVRPRPVTVRVAIREEPFSFFFLKRSKR